MSKRWAAALAATWVIAGIGAFPAFAADLTVERLHGDPALQGPGLRNTAISPDGKFVSYLRGSENDADQLDLWVYEINTGKTRVLVRSTDLLEGAEQLSDEEKNRRERQRIRGRGIVSYSWDTKGEALLFPIGGDVYLYDLAGQRARHLTRTDAYETDPRVSPQGRYVSYVRDDELYVHDLSRGRERRVTRGSTALIRNAVAEFVAQEEMRRNTGYWWSPDDSRIAFTQIDESPVAIAERLEFGVDGTRTQRQRYPFAGTDNVRIRLGITTPAGRRPVWVDLGEEQDIYIARVYWARDAQRLYVARQTRDQKRLDFLAVNARTGDSTVLFSETSPTWINLHKSFRALDAGAFLRGSEQSGFLHLYRHQADGTIDRALTQGEWSVSELDCVNRETGEVYFTGWRDSVLERHIYKTSLSGGTPKAITSASGWHSATFAKNCATFILNYSNDNQPPQVSVLASDGTRLAWINENRMDDTHPYAPYRDSHLDWSYGTLEAADSTPLHYKLLKPEGLKPGEKRPAIILVYGGPGAQTVRRSWRGLFDQLLADQGYVVFRLDNRGMANRGKAFEDPLHERMGGPEVEDQIIGARYLQSLPFVDGDRIGVSGWSYGGFMTLMLMSKAPDLFKAGVSGAPVTDWRLYDTHYTERFLGHPEKGDVYRDASVFKYLGNLTGKLLLIHGMSDDNVLFQNSVQLMDALQAQGTSFELMTYPGEKHGFRKKANRIHRDRLILDFFKRTL